jgi:diguanylate cyclase (GGDEF)-like protein
VTSAPHAACASPTNAAVRDSAAALAVAGVAALYLLWSLDPPAVDLAAIRDLLPQPVQVLTCLCLLVGSQKAADDRAARAWALAALAYAGYVLTLVGWASAGRGASPVGDLCVLVVVAVAALSQHAQRVVAEPGMFRSLLAVDSLTGLPNRRSFSAAAQLRLDESRSSGGPLTLLLLDIDLLASINDVYGRMAGDEAIIGVADAVRSMVGSGRFVARVGADELAVLLPEDIDHTTPLVPRLHAAASAVRLPHALGRTLTVSIGLAVARPDDDAAALTIRAERALGAAKQAGPCGMLSRSAAR